MKMNRLNPLLFLIAFMFPFGFVACGGDDDDNNTEEPVDTKKPVISLTSPSENDNYIIGINDFVVEGEFTDNVELDSCSFSLSNNINKSISKLKSIDEPEIWEPDAKGFTLTGKSKTFEAPEGEVFGPIPADAEVGTYTLHIEVIDAAGNIATQSISFTISAE